VDDGSTDSTPAIARTYCSPEVQVVTQENRGSSTARNHALSLAQGEYIQWLDADDLLAADKIAVQMEGADSGLSSRILLSSAWGQFYLHPDQSCFVPSSLWQDLEPVEWLFRKIAQNEWMVPASWLVSRKLTDMAGPWNESLTVDDDGEYFCRVVLGCRALRFVHEARSFKRKGNPESLSHSSNLTRGNLESQLQSLCFHIETLRSMEKSERTRMACLKLLQRWLRHFYPKHPDLVERMATLAAELGSTLEPPDMGVKFRAVSGILGWENAHKVQRALRRLREVGNLCREHLRSLTITRNRDSDSR
jgi:glycosyltransferase involved in cell wall biosynthesis